MLDLGLLMYGGLLILALWRVLCFYRCCGMWLSFLNYTSLLYIMLTASLAYAVFEFFERLKDPRTARRHRDVNARGVLSMINRGKATNNSNTFKACSGWVERMHEDIGGSPLRLTELRNCSKQD